MTGGKLSHPGFEGDLPPMLECQIVDSWRGKTRRNNIFEIPSIEFVKQSALKQPFTEDKSLVMSNAPRFNPSPGSHITYNFVRWDLGKARQSTLLGYRLEPFGLFANELAQHGELIETRPPEAPLAFGIRPPLLFDRFGRPPRPERHRKVDRRGENIPSLERQRSVLERQLTQPPAVTAFVKGWVRHGAPRQESPFRRKDAYPACKMFCVSRKPRISHIPLWKILSQKRGFVRYRRSGLAARRNASQFMQPVAQIPAEFSDGSRPLRYFFERSWSGVHGAGNLRADLTTSFAASDRTS